MLCFSNVLKASYVPDVKDNVTACCAGDQIDSELRIMCARKLWPTRFQ